MKTDRIRSRIICTGAALVAAFVFFACTSKGPVSVTKGFIQTPDGVRLFYTKVGNGSKIVLIPNGLYYLEEFKPLADSRTLLFYDVRNRGLSDTVADKSKLTKGILQDVEDLETVRKHFGMERVDLMGHSYIGLMIGLYAKDYPDHVNRIVQISPAQPDASKQYAPPLSYTDDVVSDVLGRLAKLQAEPRPEDPIEACKQFWSVLGPINVFDSAHATKIDWGRCDQTNERNFMQYWAEFVFPSIQNVRLKASDLTQVQTPVLIVHGDKDRSAPYGGAKDWESMWPNARLVTLPNVAHAPWIEAPEPFYQALREFLQ